MSYKLNLGSGAERFNGFINIDLYDDTADIQADITEVPLADGCASEIMCIQVIEHIPYQKSQAVFNEMYRLLEENGTAHIETPDIDVIAKRIVDTGEITENTVHNLVGQYYRPWDKDRYDDWENNAASIHRNPWNFRRLWNHAKEAGFTEIESIPMECMHYKYEENLAVRLKK